MSEPYAIGIDLGGTKLKAVAVSASGLVLGHERVETHDDWPRRCMEIIQRSESAHGKTGWIGVAAPGLARADGSGISWMRGRMSEVQDFDFTLHLGRDKRVPVVNDAQAALLGEMWQGAARGANNAVLLTLGTGVGGAMVCDGRLLKGHLGRAGHLGHISLGMDGTRDIVGTPGSLEDAIGECTLQQRSGGRFAITRELVKAHVGGDEQATKVWMRSIKALAVGIVSIVNAVDPEVVILGGGIAQAGGALFDPLAEFMDEFEWRLGGSRVRIVAAQLGDEAGALGAAWNAMNFTGGSD